LFHLSEQSQDRTPSHEIKKGSVTGLQAASLLIKAKCENDGTGGLEKFFSNKVSTDELRGINLIFRGRGGEIYHIQYANLPTLVIGASSAPDGLA
jgi:hypothetical protein